MDDKKFTNDFAFPVAAHRMSLQLRFRTWWTSGWLEKIQRLSEFYWVLKTQYYYRLFFGRMGRHSKIIEPMRLRNVHNIHIGDRTIINKGAFLLTLQADESVVPHLTIGDGCIIGHMNHITCVGQVQLGRNILTADRVYISDHSHGYSDPGVPIMKQRVVSKGTTSIGDGTWLGEKVVVLSCNIGKNCVVGSNAVVLNDIPDYSVAVGVPARVIQRFNPNSQLWERVGRPHE
jgi:acetyltransferase-like isoleucine patch superfamily enzyme